jgi:hypothetical protein
MFSSKLLFMRSSSLLSTKGSLVLCVCFVDRCLSFCPFSFSHYVVWPSSIYGFWLPVWYLQTFLYITSIRPFRVDCTSQRRNYRSYFYILRFLRWSNKEWYWQIGMSTEVMSTAQIQARCCFRFTLGYELCALLKTVSTVILKVLFLYLNLC